MSNFYEAKIKYLANLFINYRPISIELINCFKDDDFKNELYNSGDLTLLLYLKTNILPSKENIATVEVALTMLALEKYDGNLWDYIRDIFPLSYNQYGHDYVDNKLRELLYGFSHDVKHSANKKYVGVPLVNAGITEYWLPEFFDFCFEIYKQNLLLARDIKDYEIENEVFETFTQLRTFNYLRDDDSFAVSGRTYKLSKYTQAAISCNIGLSDIAKIGATCIKLMISAFNNENKKPMPYYERAFNKWHKKTYEVNKNTYDKENSVNETIYTKGDSLNRKFFLQTKLIHLSEDVDVRNVRMELYSKNGFVRTIDDIDIESAVVGYIVKSKKIFIDFSPLDNVSYKLLCNQHVLYDSGNNLFFDVLFFNPETGSIIYPNEDYNGRALVISKSKVTDGIFIRNIFDCYLSEIEINSFKKYLIDGCTYVFSKVKTLGLFGDKITWAKAFTNMDQKYFDIYNDIDRFLFEFQGENTSFKVYADNKLRDDIKINLLKKYENGINIYEVDLNSVFDNGWHELKILSSDGNIIPGSYKQFVVDSSLSKTTEQVDDKNYIISLTSTIIGSCESFFNRTDHKLEYFCNFPGRNAGNITVFPCVLSWSIDKKEWLSSKSKICFDMINKVNKYLYISGLNKMKAIGYVGKMELNLSVAKDTDGSTFIDIGPLLNYKNMFDSAFINVFSDDGQEERINIDFIPIIDSLSSFMRYNEEFDAHDYHFAVDTNSTIEFNIYDYESYKTSKTPIIKQNINKNTTLRAYMNLYPLKKYVVELYVLVGMFGEKRLFFRMDYTFFSLKGLLNKYYMIHSVITENYKRKPIKQVAVMTKPFPLVKFTKFDEKTKEFMGIIFAKNKITDKTYKAISNVKITDVDKKSEDSVEFYMETSNEDWILYNRNTKSFHYGTDDSQDYKIAEPIVKFYAMAYREGK